MITDTVTQIKVELAKTPPDRAALVVLFGRAKEEIAASGGRYFWSTGYWRWIELAFWAWFGVLVYLLTNIHSFFLKQQGRFKEFTPWYIATALRGPIIALLILFFLLSAQAQVFGISIALDDAPIELLVFLAGVLGFFSREAREVLEMLVSKIFPEAWARTHPEEKLAIDTPPKQISLGESHRFKVRPERDVIWSSLPADLGEIAQDGTYTAPPASETDKKDKQVLVLATSTQNPDEYATVRVTLKLPPSS